MTVGATSSSGQNTKSAGFRNRLLPRRTRLQSFQLCVTLTASGETITSEHHFTHKLFNKRKKSSHTRLKTTTKKKITSWHLEFPLTLSTNLSAAWRTGLSPSGAPWRRSVGSQRKSNSVFKKAKLRKTWETVAGLCRCSLSSHPAKRAHWRCANASNTCLLYASSHPPTPTPPSAPLSPPSTAVVMATGGRGGPEMDASTSCPPPCWLTKAAGNYHGRQIANGPSTNLICSPVILLLKAALIQTEKNPHSRGPSIKLNIMQYRLLLPKYHR